MNSQTRSDTRISASLGARYARPQPRHFRPAHFRQWSSRIGPKWIAATLTVGLALTVVPAALSAQEDQGRADQSRQQIDRQQIDRLIEQLGNQDYFVRQRAQAALAKLSFQAFDALSAATIHEDLEIAARAKHLLELMRVEWTTEDDPPEVKKLLKGYELFSGAKKRFQIRALARLPDEKGVPALCRLVRYEASPLLSKQAALGLLGGLSPAEPPSRQLAELLRKNLGPSRRTSAGWLLAWLRFGDDPQTALDDWTKLIEQEHSEMKRSRTQTDARIVAMLIRLQIPWFKKLDRNDRALAAMHRLVDLEAGNLQTMAELLGWLVDQQDWASVDKLTARFPKQFARSPILLYTVAQAQVRKGNNDQAEQTAQRALKFNPGNDPQQLIKHYDVARILWQRGLFQWAQREYRHIIETGSPGGLEVMTAHSLLGELLHDQQKELEAAKTLEELVEAVGNKPNQSTVIRGRLPGIRSRMYYFFACHWQGRKDSEKQREFLDKGIEADPADVDVLIARYRLAGQNAEYRKKTLGLIERAAAKFRREITRAPDDTASYNQFAWLVANTEGDLDAALKFSKRSIQLLPASAGYYDTLAHVYFAKGDYENAVKTQTRAAQMEPHTRAIARQLEVFRKKLAETKKKEAPPPGKPGA